MENPDSKVIHTPATSRVRTNVRFWKTAPQLAVEGYELIPLPPMEDNGSTGFNVIFKHPKTNHEVMIIDPQDDIVLPALIRPGWILEFLSIYTDLDSVIYPLGLAVEAIVEGDIATIETCEPKPYLTWIGRAKGDTILVDGTKRRKHLLHSIFELSREAGCKAAKVDIPYPLQEYFRAKDRRTQEVTKALEKRGMKLLPWTRQKNIDYRNAQKVLSRGDNDESIRQAIAELVGLPTHLLWPKINWPKYKRQKDGH